MTEQQLSVAAPAPGTMPNTGQWGWYKDHEGNQFRRVTSLVKKVETDNEGLKRWFWRQVAIGMALRTDLVLAVKAVGREPVEGYSDSQKSTLNKIAKDALEAAKTTDGGVLGTAVHTLTERADRGENLDQLVTGLPPEYAAGVRAYRQLIELNGWQTTAIERSVRTMFGDGFETVGTLDRIYVIPGLSALFGTGTCQYGDQCPDAGLPGHGDAVIGDVKTEGDPARNGLHIGPQLATYSRAKQMWVPKPAYERMPCVRQDVAVVVQVRDGLARPLFVDINRGWVLAQRAYEQTLDESIARRKVGQAGAMFAEMPGIKLPQPVSSFVPPAPKQGPKEAPPQPGDRITAHDGKTMVAVAGRDGWIRWEPDTTPQLATAVLDAARANDAVTTLGQIAEPAVGTQVTVAGIDFTKIDTTENVVTHGALDTVDKQAIENVWSAAAVSDLAETYRIYTDILERTWGGRVAEAAEARRRQIECPQRALHTAGKCACGWTPGVAP